MYKIDHDIPRPPLPPGQRSRQSPGRESKYPFRKMGVDDSFFVPLYGRPRRKLLSSITSSALNVFKASGHIQMEHRVIKGVEGLRVWRIA